MQYAAHVIRRYLGYFACLAGDVEIKCNSAVALIVNHFEIH